MADTENKRKIFLKISNIYCLITGGSLFPVYVTIAQSEALILMCLH